MSVDVRGGVGRYFLLEDLTAERYLIRTIGEARGIEERARIEADHACLDKVTLGLNSHT